MSPRLHKSIATVCLSGGLIDKLQAIAAAGFEGVEIFENDLLTYGGGPAEVRKIAQDLGLAITIYQPFRDFEAMPEPQRSRNLDRAERKFDVMQALGTDLVLVCSNVQAAAEDDDSRAAADLREMAKRAAQRGLRVGYEALAWGRRVDRWRHAWRIVQQADHPALGLILDSFHTLSVGDDCAGLADVPAEKIFFVQLADAPRMSMDVLSWSRHFRNFPGQGELDVTGFVRAVIHAGYRGPLSLEIFNDDFRAGSARQNARDGLRSLIWVESEAGGPALPPPPTCGGIEFIEFAVDDASARELGDFFAALGFHHAGAHRSKNVQLYRQGQVHLVLNQEPDSAAAEHFHLHGPSVCALGLRVENAARAMARAHALLCPGWTEHIGAGERSIPALRAPDGALIYLVEPDPSGRSLWQSDFRLRPALVAPDHDALTGVDHIAQAIPSGQINSFILFYRAVLGFEADQSWEITDPRGIISGKVMQSSGGAVRTVLNVTGSQETATGRFLSAYGAGVHHIAFAARDIQATMAEARRRGAKLLPIPDNYYDDLETRWPLDDAELTALKRAGLLYDRDEHGEFRHAYTRNFARGLFCEIVERRNYQGYGVANAPFRTAAQAQ